jgi:hypothetical protein
MTTTISSHWTQIQANLFPMLEECIGPLSENHMRVAAIIEFANVKKLLSRPYHRRPGRPSADRVAIAHALIVRAVYNLTETKQVVEKLRTDPSLRKICGFRTLSEVPGESTFSRAFAEFARSDIATKLHDVFVLTYHSNRLIGHVSRDSTAIEAREKAEKKQAVVEPSAREKKKRGRPKKGEEKLAPEPTRIEQQLTMTLPEMLAELPKACDYGSKRNAKGFKTTWKGYKYHIDTIDGDIPISHLLTSASVHDSQADIPLATLTEQKVQYLYEIKDSAYDSAILRQRALDKGHVTLTDFNRRSPKDNRCFAPHEKIRYKNRSSAERVNSNLKDNYGGRMIRVRGHDKVSAYLTFGLLCITVEQTLRLLT